MATWTVATDINMDDIGSGAWADGDTLVINDGAVVTCNTHQTKFWVLITINDGKLLIENNSTTQMNRFLMGKNGASNASVVPIKPSSALGAVEIKGNWIELGTGTGAAQTLTVPLADFIPVVFVETGVGTNEYVPWMNATVEYGWTPKTFRYGIKGMSPGNRGNFFIQDAAAEPYAQTSRMFEHWGTTLRFGEGNTNKIPAGCKVRVPNIIMTEGTLANYYSLYSQIYSQRVRNYYEMDLSNGGTLVADTVLFECFLLNATQAKSVSIKNCGFSICPFISDCYDVTIDNMAVTIDPPRRYYVSPRWYNRDNRYWNVTWELITNANIKNLYMLSYGPSSSSVTETSMLTISTSSNVTLENIFLFYCNSVLVTSDTYVRATLELLSVTDSTVKNLKLYPTSLRLTKCSRVTVNGVTGASHLWNSTTNVPSGAAIGAGYKFTMNPATGEMFEDGVPVYFKIRSYDRFDKFGEYYYDYPAVLSGTPYTGYTGTTESSHPFYFGVIPLISSDAWKVMATWYGRTSPEYLPFVKVELYRSTVAGTLGTMLTSSTSTSQVSYSDTTVALGTTYYYTARYYYTATEYTDSAQQIAIIPALAPTAANIGTVTNIMPYSTSASAWTTKTSCTTGTGIMSIRDTVTGTGSYSMYFSAVTGVASRTVTTVVGTTYCFSFHMCSAGVPGDTPQSVTISMGTASVDCALTPFWERYYVVFTATATTTTISIKANANTILNNTNGLFYLTYGQVEVGTTPGFPVYVSGSTAITMRPCVDLTYLSVHTKEGFRGIEILPVVSAATVYAPLFYDIFAGLTPDFVPSEANLIGSSLGNMTPLLHLDASTFCTITDIVKEGSDGSPSTVSSSRAPISLINGAAGNKIINVEVDSNIGGTKIIGTSGNGNNNNLFHNVRCNNLKYRSSSPALVTDSGNTGNTFQNIRSNFGDFVFSMQSHDTIAKGFPGGFSRGAGGANQTVYDDLACQYVTSYPAIDNTMFAELYWTATTGALAMMMTPGTPGKENYTILAGNPRFNLKGGLYFTRVGDSIEFKWPHRILGVSGFKNIDPQIGNTYLGGSSVSAPAFFQVGGQGLIKEYSISTDGATWSDWKELTGANLSAETLSATTGFYLKMRFTSRLCFRLYGGVAAFWNTNPVGTVLYDAASSPTCSLVIDRVYYDASTGAGLIWCSAVTGTWGTGSNLYLAGDGTNKGRINGDTAGAFMPNASSSMLGIILPTIIDQTVTYPVSRPTLTLTGLKAGSEVRIYNKTTWEELAGVENSGTSFAAGYNYFGDVDVTIRIMALGYQWLSIDYTLTAEDATIPIQQVVDRVYANA